MSSTNRIVCTGNIAPRIEYNEVECLKCEGAGLYLGRICDGCNGHGLVISNKFGVTRYDSNEEQKHAKTILQ